MTTLVFVGCNDDLDLHSLVAEYDRALLIEPLPEVAGELIVRYAGDKAVTIECVACGVVEGWADFHVCNRGLSSSLGMPTEQAKQLFHDSNLDITRTDRVYVKRLPDTLRARGIDYVHFLKLDCQGMDARILKTMEPWLLERLVGKIQLEVNGPGFLHYSELPNREADVMEFMAGMPYELTGKIGLEFQPDLLFELSIK